MIRVQNVKGFLTWGVLFKVGGITGSFQRVIERLGCVEGVKWACRDWFRFYVELVETWARPILSIIRPLAS